MNKGLDIQTDFGTQPMTFAPFQKKEQGESPFKALGSAVGQKLNRRKPAPQFGGPPHTPKEQEPLGHSA